MTDRLRHKRVLITGAAGAFGRATTTALRERGAVVTGIDLAGGPGVTGCDITDREAVTAAVADAATRLGGIDLLIHCAGIGAPSDIGLTPTPATRHTLDVNLWGPANVTTAALPHLLTARGHVIVVASALAYATLPFAGDYAIAKRALTGYADALRVEHGTHLRVTTVYPGYVDTPIHDASVAAGVGVKAVAREETVDDVVRTIVSAAAARRPPRDRGTSRIGHLQLSAAQHFPRLTDAVVRRRIAKAVRDTGYRDAPVAQPMLRRHGLASGDIGDRPRSVTASDGTQLHVSVTGPQDASVAVVYLHGWCLTGEIYRGQPGALARRDVPATVVNCDLRGHGRSGPAGTDGTTIDRLADDVAEVIDAVCPDKPVILVGHSIGGMTILALAQRAPELFGGKVSGVVLVNTSSGGLDRVRIGLPGLAARVIRKLLPGIFARRVSRWRRHRPGTVPRPRTVDRMIARYVLFGKRVTRDDLRLGRRLIATTPADVMAGFWPELQAHNRADALPLLAKIPVRILAGTRDRLTPLSHSRRIADALPEARLQIHPDAGHTIPLERNEELAETIAALVHRQAVTPQ